MLAPARFFLLSPSLCLPLPSFLSSLTILFRLSFCPHSLPSSPAGDPSPPPPASRSPRTHRCLASSRRLALHAATVASGAAVCAFCVDLESRKAKIESRPRISNRESRCESPFSSRPSVEHRTSNIDRRLSAELVCVVGIGVLCVFVCVCYVFVLMEVVVCMLGIAPLV